MSDTIKLTDLPYGFFSYSQYRMYIRCPYQFYCRYILGKKKPPKSSLILGTAVHGALEWGYKEKIKTKTHPGVDEWQAKYIDCLEDFYKIVPPSEIDWGEEDNKDKLKDDGTEMVKVYDEQVAKNTMPEDSEKDFELKFENVNYKMIGQVDLVKSDTIVDFKTGARSYDEDIIHMDDQLTLYQIAISREYLEIQALIRLKREKKVQIMKCKGRTNEQMKDFLENIAQTIQGVKAGIFWKTNDLLKCKWCGYRGDCGKR